VVRYYTGTDYVKRSAPPPFGRAGRAGRGDAVRSRALGLLVCLSLGGALPGAELGAEILRFRYNQGEQYRLITEVEENVYINGILSQRASILNKIAVETLEVRETAGLLSGRFQVSERASGLGGSFSLSEEHVSRFWRDAAGAFTIDAQYVMPVVRDVPLFPDGELEPGDTWTAAGEEVHDLRGDFYDAPLLLRFPIQVHYTYLRNEAREGKELAVLAIEYTLFERFDRFRSSGGRLPVRISGRSEQTYFWDIAAGRPSHYQESFDFIFYLADGQVIEFEGTSSGRLLEAVRLDKEKLAQELERELERQGLEEVSVEAEEEGVTITLQNIQFPPDSALLWVSEQRKLARIAEILRAYPERDLLVTGHTARIGSEESSQALSEQRARAVGDFLLSLGAVAPSRLITRGMGSREPLADNASEEGRQLNRRVELTILEN
jgi:outer membrane protein OmpA-like peptidoglycan-associated protein